MTTELDVYNATDEQILAAGFPEFTEVTPTPVEDAGADLTETTEVVETVSDESVETVNEVVESAEDTTDAAKQLADLFTPFTANGKEIKVDNIEDAKRLMQMGAGYNKKMANLKPHLKLIKMLGNNDLLDENKLAHLIDISKKNPDAIGKLLAESDIDPLNLNAGNTYTPNTYTVTDTEMDLDNVLGELKDSPHYSETLDVIVNKWDATSKELLINSPENISLIHDQISNGIYKQVMAVVDRERALGKLTGLSDLAAYDRVGNMMHEKGMFAHQTVTHSAAANTPKQPSADELKLKSRKLAASPTKTSPNVGKDIGNFNPLTATDEEIMNMSLDKFL